MKKSNRMRPGLSLLPPPGWGEGGLWRFQPPNKEGLEEQEDPEERKTMPTTKKMWRGCRKKCSTYQQRNELLRKAGFKSYRDYLASALWAEIRRRVLDRDGHRCKLCRLSADAVHHRSYTRSGLRGSNLGQLVALCNLCHRRVEIGDGFKRTLLEAEHEYRRLEGERDRAILTPAHSPA